MTSEADITVILAAPAWRQRCPRAAMLCRRAAAAALAAGAAPGACALGACALAIVLAGNPLVRRLNHDFRGQDAPTNVLSFAQRDGAPMPAGPDAPAALGDVVLAYGTVAREARAQGKTLAAHMIHLVVHGVLHLLGHDHMRAPDARRMEALEVAVLAGLGLADPYRGDTAA